MPPKHFHYVARLHRVLAPAASLAFLLATVPAAAQIVSVPSFQVATTPTSTDVEVAVGADGAIVFQWQRVIGSAREVYVRRYSPAGTALGPATRIDVTGDIIGAALAARAGGGYRAAFLRVEDSDSRIHLFGVPLDASALRLGSDVRVDETSSGLMSASITALPSGTLFTWTRIKVFLSNIYEVTGRVVDAAGQPIGPQFSIGTDGLDGRDAAATSDGGFAVAWQNHPGQTGTMVRTFDADGTPRGSQRAVSGLLNTLHVAGHPTDENGAVIGTVGNDAIAVTRFARDGAPIGDFSYVSPTGSAPDLEYAPDGSLFTVWSQFNPDADANVPRGRILDANLEYLYEPFWISNEAASSLRTARLADGGGFVVAWASASAIYGAVVRLCSADAACGDGLVTLPCAEQCDDGAANSDTTPDACRTNCQPAHCGDSVIDGGETCDDGNVDPCDGCNALCQTEVGLGCGDGIPFPTCGESCDDGNLIDGDGCTAACVAERSYGGGKRSLDCLIEWQIDNPTNQPRLGKDGGINREQHCVDDDPACDFDGGTPGGCTFHLAVCANNTNLAECKPPDRLASWQLMKPSESRAVHSPVDAGVRAALLGTVPGAIVGPDTTDLCSPWAAIEVPLRGAPGVYRFGQVKLKTSAAGYHTQRDIDALKLVCLPAAP